MIKKILTGLSFFVFVLQAEAQVFPVDTLQYNGDVDKLVNIVILPDGYTADELGKFKTDAQNFLSNFFTASPFVNYKNYFNSFQVNVPSNESGAKHPHTAGDCGSTSLGVTNPNNYFGSSFDTYGIHRLLVASNYSKIYNVLISNVPSYDLVMILVNSTEYGGSGGNYAVASLNASSNEVAIHEIGHSFGNLGDEYWAGAQYATEAPNRSQESDPAKNKWRNWMNIDNVGIYPYTEDPSWYRPHQNCKMRYLNKPFCRVCRESFIEEIHNLVSTLYDYSPVTANLETTTDLAFNLITLNPSPNTNKIVWQLDAQTIASNTNQLNLQASLMTDGLHTLTATVLDTTADDKQISHLTAHLYSVKWNITKSTSVFNIGSEMYQSKVATHPNPFTDKLVLEMQFEKPVVMEASLLNQQGVFIRNLIESTPLTGSINKEINLTDVKLPSGFYFVKFTVDGFTFLKPVIKVD